MKVIDVKNDNLVGLDNATEFSVDQSQIAHLFKQLSSSLYSYPIQSICRELVSNCYDANTEAGKKDDVIYVHVSGGKIHFRDVGDGMSKEKILNVYTKFGSSTRRNSNNYIGAKG